jgi:thiosulfate/3-mercaptopyruvate sulfurtransferase
LTSRLGQVRRHVEQARKNNPLLIDSREPREFKGATPYGETRGGHLPGAINLHYRALLDARGRLLPRSRLRAKLGKLGIKKSQPLIIYCTGGVRSGWLTVVLAHLGYRNVKNYPGSMWQWAARDAKTHPLVK